MSAAEISCEGASGIPAVMEGLVRFAGVDSVRTVRLDLSDTDCLDALEHALGEKLTALSSGAELVGGLAPAFIWWTSAGLWPREPGGWTVLLRKGKFEGRPGAAMLSPGRMTGGARRS